MEVMLALAVLAVATLALVSVRTHTLQAQQKTQERQVAAALAATVMVEIEATVTEDFDRNLESDFSLDTTDWPEGFSYALREKLENPDLKWVEVVLSWEDRNGPQEFKLWTKFARGV